MSGLPWPKSGLYGLLILLASFLTLGVSCGTSDTAAPEQAQEATTAPAATSPAASATATAPQGASQASATATPIAAAAATRPPRAATGTGPTGSLNIAFKEIGPYTGHPQDDCKVGEGGLQR